MRYDRTVRASINGNKSAEEMTVGDTQARLNITAATTPSNTTQINVVLTPRFTRLSHLSRLIAVRHSGMIQRAFAGFRHWNREPILGNSKPSGK
jgi:hypothetical protein